MVAGVYRQLAASDLPDPRLARHVVPENRLRAYDIREAIDGPAERDRAYAAYVDAAYQQGRALIAATIFELDDVIDEADSRAWIRRLAR